MKEKRNLILIVALFIVIAFTLLLFFGVGNNEKTGIQICGIIFTIITELIVFGNILFINNKKLNTFMIAGLSSTSFLYAICSIIFNSILFGVFKTIKSILIFNFALLLVYLFIDTMIFLFKKEEVE